ncbi:conserved hypothetical protein [Magnetococcus marinus MC-1]|uniref:Serine hydrolase FSH domain-containing protein n=2 Tax=Magnetococcus TaxID=162171 RepID=A0LCE5_MAGMM|nr:conserved hypothetical protein [Magnetococcus marinus MC-1]
MGAPSGPGWHGGRNKTIRHGEAMKKLQKIVIFCWAVLLPGCMLSTQERLQQVDNQAEQVGLHRAWVDGGSFDIWTASRLTQPEQPITVYIEGDGFAWVTRYRPSDDPTPHLPIAWQLAREDPAPNLLYLARPCQYSMAVQGKARGCRVPIWTHQRFSAEVLETMQSALLELLSRAHAESASLNLVGFSGGAAIAALLAESGRFNVRSLQTVSANLDHRALTRWHGVSEMQGSLNPMDGVAALRNIPQRHLVGAEDTITPPKLVAQVVQRIGHCATLSIYPDLTHGDTRWGAVWKQLPPMRPVCAAP